LNKQLKSFELDKDELKIKYNDILNDNKKLKDIDLKNQIKINDKTDEIDNLSKKYKSFDLDKDNLKTEYNNTLNDNKKLKDKNIENQLRIIDKNY
jgi:hypothetical protein